MVGFFIKLPFKLALLPLRVVRKAAKAMCSSGSAPDTKSDSVSRTSDSSSMEPATQEEAAPSPFDVQIDPSSVIQRLRDGEALTFLDVRQAQELSATGMIEGALHIPSQDLPRRMDELDKESELFVYCAAGVRSLDAVVFLREKGFEQAWSLGGGLPHWQQDGGDVVNL
jgi:rhodanese-related sulfurtransferase